MRCLSVRRATPVAPRPRRRSCFIHRRLFLQMNQRSRFCAACQTGPKAPGNPPPGCGGMSRQRCNCGSANNVEHPASTSPGWPRRPGRDGPRESRAAGDPTSGRQGQSSLLTTPRARRDVLAAQPLRPVEVMKLVAVLALGLCRASPVPSAEDVPVTSKSPEARALVKSALSHIDNVHIGEAVADLKKAIELDPDLATAHALLAALSPPDEAKQQIELEQRNDAKMTAEARIMIEGIA